MKLLFLCWEFGPGTGGIGQYLYQIAKGSIQYGHEVVVVTGVNSAQNIEHGYFDNVYRLYDKTGLYDDGIGAEIIRIAEKHQVDIIEGADHLGECAKLIKVTNRPNIAIKYHGCQVINRLTSAEIIYPWQRLTVGLALWRIRRQRRAERCCVEDADAVMYPSAKIRDDIVSQNYKIPAQAALIPNMLSEVPPLQEEGESATPTLLFVGRIEARKGIEYLPDIMEAVQTVFPNAILEIAGGDQYARGLGSLQKWLGNRCGTRGINIKFLGPLGPDELNAAYRRCWILIFPSKWDNFPMAVLEAMSLGKPVVSSGNGGMTEMLSGTGAPVAQPDSEDFSESIIRLLNDQQLRGHIGRACREKVTNNYMPEQVLPLYFNFLQSIT